LVADKLDTDLIGISASRRDPRKLWREHEGLLSMSNHGWEALQQALRGRLSVAEVVVVAIIELIICRILL
jgi:hypothetical protein